ncbi:DNA-binding PadR family transcriptional regulator [Nocardioides sp. BE266]|uniref:helix-turn-helix transcriptional regulator n=1 Tax=Nocardioides sp. BE266 TaxID=2817725 RepID=UPI0028577D21|nr:helix-turn-helix transcriptional regulator [Nocardioides sp. BE266]MDR7255391.1 DNA-binding PadR family transcriptional regulator [Nocardioides sp. BE266]
MSQEIPVTGYAILGLLTFGDELTGYEIKQRADITLRFYWVSPAMSQIYTELRRLTEHGLVRADARQDGGREVTSYAITAEGQVALRAWMDGTPAGFPVLKHTVLLRLLIGHATEPDRTRQMLHDYLGELDAAIHDLSNVRESLRGADRPGEPFRFPSLVADWGLDYFAAEAQHAQRALSSLDETGTGAGETTE